MKRRVNILCALFFLLFLGGYAVVSRLEPKTDVFKASTGMDEGMSAAKYARVSKVLEASREICVEPNDLADDNAFIVKNQKTGEEMRAWPLRMRVEMKKDGFLNKVPFLIDVMAILYVLSLWAAFAAFIWLIVNINQQDVFSWGNVWKLRIIGYCLIVMGLDDFLTSLSKAIDVAHAVAIEHYTVNYIEDVEYGFLVAGVVGLIVAEIFALGLKQKKELELTI